MKVNTKFITVLLIALVVVSIGVYYAGNQEFSVTTTGDFSISSNSDLYVPEFGFLRCEERDTTWTLPTSGYESFSATTITCQETGTLTQDCVVNFRIPTTEEANKAYSYLCYIKLDIDDPIPSGADCQEEIYAQNFLGTENPGVVHSTTLQKDQYIYAEYIEQNLFNRVVGGGSNVNKGEYSISYNPFFIYQYDDTLRSTGDYLSDTQDCILGGDFERANPIVEKIHSDSFDYQEVDNNAISQDFSENYLRVPDRTVSYVAKLDKVNPDFVTIVDGDKFCVGQKLYPIVQMETSDGVYYVADTAKETPLGTVECCNDADALAVKGPGWFCNSNQEFVQKSEGTETCRIDSDCTLSSGVAGIGVLYYEECVSGECVLQEKEIECASDYECPSGVCIYDSRNPQNSYCEEVDLAKNCGNNVCEISFGENENTCEEDCGQRDKEDIDSLTLLSIVGGAILLLVLALRFRKKGPDVLPSPGMEFIK